MVGTLGLGGSAAAANATWLLRAAANLRLPLRPRPLPQRLRLSFHGCALPGNTARALRVLRGLTCLELDGSYGIITLEVEVDKEINETQSSLTRATWAQWKT